MKYILNETQYSSLIANKESVIINEMAYPESFSMEHFKTLTSFKDRVRYCDDHLIKIKSGSSRIAYKVDNEKVLKLAKNAKGIAQNEAEADYGLDNYSIMPKIFDVDENYLWLEMELARRVKASDFKRIISYDFDTICDFIRYYHYEIVNPSKYIHLSNPLSKEEYDTIDTNEWMYSMMNFIGDYGNRPINEYCRLSTYGLVERDGEDWIVAIDNGLTDEVYDTFYKPKEEMVWR